jgi:S-adenosylmethionine:tRNA ribosyltransferase-isomerase
MPYLVEQFDFHLPDSLIAQQPLEPRHHSRMMLLERGSASVAHRVFHELPGLLPADALLVLNNTRVLPRRLKGELPGGTAVEALLLEDLGQGQWRAMVKKARRLKAGKPVAFAAGNLPAEAVRRCEDGCWVLRFEDAPTVPARLARYGLAPLPPYIRRKGHAPELDERDKAAYQTCYATVPGAIAAPTAGLHFVPEVLAQVRARGIEIAELTLHVGVGTFTPVKTRNPELHKMHEEWYELPDSTARQIVAAREAGRPVIAVGTTAVRALESWARDVAAEGAMANGAIANDVTADGGKAEGHSGWSNLFIHPPYSFRVVDGMITNFHQPRSTLLMLVAAFHGLEPLLSAYREAVGRQYRFFSYGDCMAILPPGRAHTS